MPGTGASAMRLADERNSGRRLRPPAHPFRLFAQRGRHPARQDRRPGEATRMPAAAITDTGNLFGALEFSSPAPPRASSRSSAARSRWPAPTTRACRPTRSCCWRRTPPAWPTCSACPRVGFLDTDPGLKPQLPLDAIAEHAAGLLLLTGGTTGPIGAPAGRGPEAGGRTPARAPGRGVSRTASRWSCTATACRSSARIEPGLIALADARGMPLVATNDCYFATPDMHEAHDALLCIAEGRRCRSTTAAASRRSTGSSRRADMRALFADLPEACDNTLAIARRCAVMAETRKPLLPVCPKVRAGQHRGRNRPRHGDRGPGTPHGRASAPTPPTRARYRERLDYELDVIAKMGFSGYFLIVADFIQWSKAQGIPVGPGRGSGAGSVAAWALTITDLDPLRFNLLFERFLNPERVSMPDFDIDFCQEGRDAVIDYVRQRIRRRPRRADHHLRQAAGPRGGARRRPRARPAVRPGQQGRRTDPQQSGQAGHAAAGDRRRTAAAAAARRRRRRSPACWKSRCSSRACTATPPPMPPAWSSATARWWNWCRSTAIRKSDFLVTQYSMKHVEQAGLVKFDFLGLTTLTILRRAENFLKGWASRSISTACRSTTRRPTRCCRRAMPAGCSRWKARACATCCARCGPTGSRT